MRSFTFLPLQKNNEQTGANGNFCSVEDRQAPMWNCSGNSSLSLALPLAAGGNAATAPSELEVEVIGLFDELRNRLLRYLMALGLPVSDGEEIVQEAFLALFQHLQRGRSRQNLRGWLFRVVRNQGLKRIAANQRQSEVLYWSFGVPPALSDPAPDPEQQATARQRTASLQAVLQALPTQDQECLRLRAEGLKYREIAEVLGMSLGSVSASLGRSLARLERAGAR